MTRISEKEVGRRLEDFIKAKDWTKKEFALRMGINPANVSKYIRGELDAQHIVIPLIANGCDVTRLFFDTTKTSAARDLLKDRFGTGSTTLGHTFSELLSMTVAGDHNITEDNCTQLRWLRVNKRNGLGVFPILVSGDRLLLCSNMDIADGDLVEAKVKGLDPTLKVAYFDRDTVMLRSINPTVRPIAALRKDVTLSKVVLVKKK